jgi:hypothetical protein
MATGNDHSLTLPGGVDFDYSLDADGATAGNQIWLSVLLPTTSFENYLLNITKVAPTTTKGLALTSVTGLVDCFGDPRSPIISNPVSNQFGGYDYTITLLTNNDANKTLTFNYNTTTDYNGTPATPATGSTFNFGTNGTGPHTVIVQAQDPAVTGTYRFYANWVTPGTAKVLSTFSLRVPKLVPAPAGSTYLSVAGIPDPVIPRVYNVTVPYGTDVTGLAADFIISANAIMTHSADAAVRQVSGTTVNDYSKQVAFTVFDQACGTVEYFVNVIVAPNGGNDIFSVEFSGTGNDPCYEETNGYKPWGWNGNFTVVQPVPPSNGSLSLTVPFDTDLDPFILNTVLTPSSVGANIEPASITAFPFLGLSGANVVTVTATNGVSQKKYLMTISGTTSNPSNAHQLTSFSFEGLTPPVNGNVDLLRNRVDVIVPFATNLNGLVASFTKSPHACVYINGPLITDKTLQISGSSANDFTNPRTYTVIAQDATPEVPNEDYYNIYVAKGLPDARNEISGLTVTGQKNCFEEPFGGVTGSGTAYGIRMRTGLDEGVHLTVTFTKPPLATCPITSPYDWAVSSSPLTIPITSESGATVNYVITPTWVTPSDKKEIKTFSFTPGSNSQFVETYTGVITGYQIAVNVPYGTNVSALVATFTLDDQYSWMTHSEENMDQQVRQTSDVSAINYSTPAAFTVYDENCQTVEYMVTVTVAPNGSNEINSIDFFGTGNDDCYAPWNWNGSFTKVAGPMTVKSVVYDGTFTLTVPYGTILTATPPDAAFTLSLVKSPLCTMLPASITSYTVGTPIPVTVTAANGISKKKFLIIINVDPTRSNEHLLKTFSFQGLTPPVTGIVTEATHRVDLTVPFATNVNGLVATFTHSDHACVYINGPGITDKTLQYSGVTVNDFSNARTYTVVAQSGNPNEDYYNVYVARGPADIHNEISGLTITGQRNCFDEPFGGVTGSGTAYGIRLRTGLDAGVHLTVTFTKPALSTCPITSPYDWAVSSSPLTIPITSESGVTVNYVITPTWVTPSDKKEIKTFSFTPGSNSQFVETYTGVITGYQIAVNVPYGTDVSALVATFTLDDQYSWMTHSEENLDLGVRQTSGVSAINYITPAAFTVYDENCQTVEYMVTVTMAPNGSNDINSIAFFGTGNDNCYASWNWNGSFTKVAGPVTVNSVVYDGTFTLTVPYGTNLTSTPPATAFTLSLVKSPLCTMLPATITSYTVGTPIPVTVTAANGISKKNFLITINVDPTRSNEHLLKTFSFHGLTPPVSGTVTEATHRVDITVPFATNMNGLVATFTHSDHACVYINGPGTTDKTLQYSGVTPNDFRNARTYTVVAQSGNPNEDYYNVYVTRGPADTHNEISGLTITGQKNCFEEAFGGVTGSGTAYGIRLRTGLDTGVHLMVAFTKPALSTCPITSPYDWAVSTSPLTIPITSESGVTVNYVITPTWVTPSDKKEIKTFSFKPASNSQFVETYTGVITGYQIAVNVPYGTNVSALVASFTLDDQYSWMTHSEENLDLRVRQTSGVSAINYITPAAFTVYDENCQTVEYMVTVTVAPNGSNDINSIDFVGTGNDNCYASWNWNGSFTKVAGPITVNSVVYDGTFTLTVPHGTNLTATPPATAFTLSLVKSPFCTMVPASVTSYTVGSPIPVTVTAANGISKKKFLITINVDPTRSNEHLLKTFSFQGLNPAVSGTVTEATHRVDLTVPFATNMNGLVATFTHSDHACVYINGPGTTDKALQYSGVTPNDFSNPRTYTVVAQSGNPNEDYYNVYITRGAADTHNELTSLSISGQTNCLSGAHAGEISGTSPNFTFRLRNVLDAGKSLSVSFTKPALATAWVGATPITSPYTWTPSGNTPLVISIRAENGAQANYTITPTWVNPSTLKSITSFSLLIPKAVGGGTWTATSDPINQSSKVITVHVPHGSVLNPLVAVFTLDDKYALMTHSEENGDLRVLQTSGVSINNYTTSVAFTVYDEGCSTVEYFVVIAMDENSGNDFTSTPGFSGTGNDPCYNVQRDGYQYQPWAFSGSFTSGGPVTAGNPPFDYDATLTLTVPFNTNLNSFILSLPIPVGASISPSLITSYTLGTPIPVTVTASNGVAQKFYLLTILQNAANTEHVLTSFKFLKANNPGLAEDIVAAGNDITHEFGLLVPYATNLTALKASFTRSDHACVYINGPGTTDKTIQIPGVTANNFGSSLFYTVVAQSGSPDESNYHVVVSKIPADTHNELTNLAITGQADCLTGAFASEISGSSPNWTIRLRTGRDNGRPLIINFTKPALATSGGFSSGDSWTPSGNTPKSIVITSESGVPVTYTITPQWVSPSTKKALTYFAFEPYSEIPGTGNSQLHLVHQGTIDEAGGQVVVHVPYGTDVTALRASFILDDKYAKLTHLEFNPTATVLQTSGISPVNYTQPGAFTVYDEACNTKQYFVTVIVDSNSGNDVTNITFSGLEYPSCAVCNNLPPIPAAPVAVSINGTNITITVPFGTDLGHIVLGGSYSPGATCSTNLANVTSYVSPLPLVVTAANGVAKKTYTLTILRAAALSGTQLLTFGFETSHNAGLTQNSWNILPISQSTYRVDVKVPFGTNLTQLVASFTHSPMACVYINGRQWTATDLQCSGQYKPNNFSQAITYTVKAQNGDEAYYNIYVSYPVDGDVCENALPLTFPVVNLFGTTTGFNDDYNQSPCSGEQNYMDGNDVVYSIELTQTGTLSGSILGSYAAVHILSQCPGQQLSQSACRGFAGGPNGGSFSSEMVAGRYFVIVSSLTGHQTTTYLLNLQFESRNHNQPDWTIDPTRFSYNGDITAEIFINDIAVTGGQGILGAFFGDVCRGVQTGGMTGPSGSYVFIIRCYSNLASGETLSFRYYDPVLDTVLAVTETIAFEDNMILGDAQNPIPLHAYFPVQVSKQLPAGWSWFSLNVTNSDMAPAKVLATVAPVNLDYIKSQTASATYYTATGWFGDLTTINPKEMYKLYLSQSATLTFAGNPASSFANPITIKAGWNWIGYIPQVGQSIANALSSINPVAADYIKNQTLSSTYYAVSGWFGGLSGLTPLDGYMLKTSHGAVLSYGSIEPVSLKSVKNVKNVKNEKNVKNVKNEKNEENVKNVKNGEIGESVVRVEDFEYSGQVNAAVYLNGRSFEAQDYCLFSVVDGQVRGASRGLWFEPTKEWIHNHLIYSNIEEGDTVRFRLYDSASDKWYQFEEYLVFKSDMRIANAFNPFLLKSSSLLNPSPLTLNPSLSVWPNPAGYLATIGYAITTDQVVVIQIIDFSGRIVNELNLGKQPSGEHVAIWDTSTIDQGVYYLRFKNSQSVYKQVVIAR